MEPKIYLIMMLNSPIISVRADEVTEMTPSGRLHFRLAGRVIASIPASAVFIEKDAQTDGDIEIAAEMVPKT